MQNKLDSGVKNVALFNPVLGLQSSCLIKCCKIFSNDCLVLRNCAPSRYFDTSRSVMQGVQVSDKWWIILRQDYTGYLLTLVKMIQIDKHRYVYRNTSSNFNCLTLRSTVDRRSNYVSRFKRYNLETTDRRTGSGILIISSFLDTTLKKAKNSETRYF